MSKYEGTLELMPLFALLRMLIAFQYQFRKLNPTFELISSASKEFTTYLIRDAFFLTVGDLIKDMILYCRVSLAYKLASYSLGMF
jgi:hypothetical protein